MSASTSWRGPHEPGSQPGASPRANRRVLVIGIDGVRLDVLARLPTPHLDALAERGFLAPVEVDEHTPTMSGPCWATIVTGVTAVKHGVWSNHFGNNRLSVFPDFATRLTTQDGRRTFVAAGWQPLLLARDGGPLFGAPGRWSPPATPSPSPTWRSPRTRRHLNPSDSN